MGWSVRPFLVVAVGALGCDAVPEVSLGDGPPDAWAGSFDDGAADAASDAVPGAGDAWIEAAADVVVESSDGTMTDVCVSALDPACVPFGAPVFVQELSSGTGNGYDEDPTLTSDMLEIYFLSTREGGPGHGDVWKSVRDSGDASWNPPTLVQYVSSPDRETCPAVTLDGLSLYVASDRDGGKGGYDIWMTSRASRAYDWPPPTPVSELNTPNDEIPRPLGDHSLAMPLSYRISQSYEYQIYMATRSSPSAMWTAPALLAWVDTANLDVDGFLSDDALSFAFSSDRLNDAGIQDLFLALRADPFSAFVTAEALASVNLATSGEAHPWLSPDQRELYFDSDRSGVPRIYHATR